ncbi:hypothetical protein J6590_047679 [Homalodisca vitripennis]|nr:hypothetical protein J6590_047679 [Homalodisca vitripennis]
MPARSRLDDDRSKVGGDVMSRLAANEAVERMRELDRNLRGRKLVILLPLPPALERTTASAI